MLLMSMKRECEYISFCLGFPIRKAGRKWGEGGGSHRNVQVDRIFRAKFRGLVPLGNWLNTLKRTSIKKKLKGYCGKQNKNMTRSDSPLIKNLGGMAEMNSSHAQLGKRSSPRYT